MNDETRQTEIQPQILQKSSIIVDRFPVCVVTSHIRKPHTVADRAMSVIAWILETERFCRNRWKQVNVTLLLSWIYYHLATVLDVVPPGFSKRCRRYALCINDTRVRCACEVRQHCVRKIIWIPWKSFQRINVFCISLIVVSFITNILLQC